MAWPMMHEITFASPQLLVTYIRARNGLRVVLMGFPKNCLDNATVSNAFHTQVTKTAITRHLRGGKLKPCIDIKQCGPGITRAHGTIS